MTIRIITLNNSESGKQNREQEHKNYLVRILLYIHGREKGLPHYTKIDEYKNYVDYSQLN